MEPENEELAERLARQRRRPLSAELGTVLSYPLRDPLAYVMMAVFVGVFATVARIAMFGAIVGVIVSRGLLHANAFTGMAAGAPAVEAPAMNEDMQAFFEDQGMTSEQIAEMQEEYAEDVSGTARRGSSSAGATGTALATLIALPFALLWWLLYSPIALVAAALFQSFMATLNPVTGIDAIRRMGSIYWEVRTVWADVIGYGYWTPSRTGITRMLSSRSILFVSSIGVTCGRSRAVPGPLSTERAPPPRRPQVTPPPSTSAN